MPYASPLRGKGRLLLDALRLLESWEKFTSTQGAEAAEGRDICMYFRIDKDIPLNYSLISVRRRSGLTFSFSVRKIVSVPIEIVVRDRARWASLSHDEVNPGAHPRRIDDEPKVAHISVDRQSGRNLFEKNESEVQARGHTSHG